MRAAMGDRIIMASGVVGGAVRDGVVVELRHPDGTPPYLVEWSDGGERSLVFPGANTLIIPAAEHTEPGPTANVTKSWRVQVSVVESGGRTTAEAVLVGVAPVAVHAVGRATRDPRDPSVPSIGDEIAVGRALRRLADTLLDEAEADIESHTGNPAHVHL